VNKTEAGRFRDILCVLLLYSIKLTFGSDLYEVMIRSRKYRNSPWQIFK